MESIHNFVPGKTVEGGAELIGSNHRLWLTYKKHFDLSFSDVKDDYENSPIRFHGRTLSFAKSKALLDELEKQLRRLNALAKRIRDPFEPWKSGRARRLDRTSFAAWVRKAKCSDLCKHALNESLATDNGVPADQQSLLGVLAMIKGGGLQRYWDDTEVYRCEGGNDQLAKRFRERLDRKRRTVITKAIVRQVSWAGDVATVTVRINGRVKVVRADDVILAVPPSVWREITFTSAALAKRLSRPPQMGWNVKYLMRLRKRFWEDLPTSPTLTDDGPVDLTWETTETAHDPHYALVAFSGADHARTCVKWKSGKRRANYMDAMRAPYPTLRATLKADLFMNWPESRWTRASYYFPRKGDVTTWGPFWHTGYGGWLHFAGEHTCFAFVGYMEGALASGHRLAHRLAKRDRVMP